jgi:putative SOS response-associated peptidase YedK
MPVILHSRDYDRWLDREQTEELPLDLLRPFDSEAMEMYEANPKVTNVRNKRARRCGSKQRLRPNQEVCPS